VNLTATGNNEIGGKSTPKNDSLNFSTLGCDCIEIPFAQISDSGAADMTISDLTKEENLPWQPLPNELQIMPTFLDKTVTLNDSDYVSGDSKEESFTTIQTSTQFVPEISSGSQEELPLESDKPDSSQPNDLYDFHSSSLNLDEDDCSTRMHTSSSEGYVDCSISSSACPNNECIKDGSTVSDATDMIKPLQTSFEGSCYIEEFNFPEVPPNNFV